MLLLDTHVVHWLAVDAPNFGRQCRARLQSAKRDDIVVSAVSIWELGLLVRKGRLRPPLGTDVRTFTSRLAATQIGMVDLDLAAVLDAEDLPDFHDDPADRFLVATARVRDLTFITADWRILNWKGRLARMDAET
jgi:PIN domain nuclease of toxin-antitoxin system